MTIQMQHVCLFKLSEILMCLPIAQVQQVFESADYQSVPLAPPAILGLVNLRGRVVTAIDLATVLGVTSGRGPESSNIVASCGNRVLSLRVDEVISVEALAPGPLRPPPSSLSPELQALARGVVDTVEGIAVLVDVEAIADAARPESTQGAVACR